MMQTINALLVSATFWLSLAFLYGIICGCLSMYVGEEKGRNGGNWFLVGFFFGVLGLIAVAGVPERRGGVR